MSVPYPDLATLPKDLQDAVSQRASLNVYRLELLTMNQLSDLVLTVGFYQLVCNFLNTFDVTTDGEGESP